MRAGDYDCAWGLSDQDLRNRDPARRDDPARPYHLRWVWDGRPYDGRHCLVRCYHGLGDTIQFARFLPRLAAQVASLVVEAQPCLIGLLERMAGLEGRGIRFVPFDPARPLPPAECDIEITELPFALRMTPGETATCYLTAGRAILPRGVIGLCHGAGDWDMDRSIPPDLFAPLCLGSRCIALTPGAIALDVLNPGGCPLDMEITAALVAACELIVTVDTMIAHLAGALGKPTWLLLKAEPDWRWPTREQATPWYPSMRLYHQTRAGDWRDPMAQVAHDLSALSPLSAES